MNKMHFYLYGDWVSALNSEDENKIVRHRQKLAKQFNVDVALIVVMKLEDVQYRG